jgi:predicted nucleotide-binding protein
MAKRQTPSAPVPKKFGSIREVDAGIAKLQRRLDEVAKLDAGVHEHRGPERSTAESNIRATILEIFGADSPEHREHQYHSISEGRAWVNMPREALQANFRNGIVHTTAMLKGLMERLEERKVDFAPAAESRAEALSKTPRVFIGHGRSAEWLKLKDFLVDRLKLTYEEFNRESPAGYSTKERLQQMLRTSDFAFLVMTSEDEHADGTRHARENVIHEIGLFQGARSFERAIILLEQGCEEFSNIAGITQIRFPQGFIMASSEEVRKVLEREGLLPQGAHD